MLSIGDGIVWLKWIFHTFNETKDTSIDTHTPNRLCVPHQNVSIFIWNNRKGSIYSGFFSVVGCAPAICASFILFVWPRFLAIYNFGGVRRALVSRLIFAPCCMLVVVAIYAPLIPLPLSAICLLCTRPRSSGSFCYQWANRVEQLAKLWCLCANEWADSRSLCTHPNLYQVNFFLLSTVLSSLCWKKAA